MRSSILPRLIRQRDAPAYLGMSVHEFNAHVRPYIIVIKKEAGRSIYYDRLDLEDWAEQFKAANGREPQEITKWQKRHPASENGAKSGTLKNHMWNQTLRKHWRK